MPPHFGTPHSALRCKLARDKGQSSKVVEIHNGIDDLEDHIPRLLRVALRIVGNRAWAEDVVQDVCVHVLSQPDSFDGRSRFSTWLHRVTVNRSIDLLRRVQRENRRQIELDGEFAGLLEEDVLLPDEAAQINELR